MKKMMLPAVAILCAFGISACSSSSSSGNSGKVDKSEYQKLQTEVSDLNSNVSDLQSTIDKLQNRLASSQSVSKSEIEKLEAKLAEAKGNEAKTAELVTQLDEQLKNAIKAATEAGDTKLAEALSKSQEEVAAIKKQADEAAKKAAEATENAKKAQEDADKAKEDAAKAKTEVTDRTPISDKIFGGASGKMVAANGKLSGAVLTKEQSGAVLSVDAPDTREGLGYITIVDENNGKTVDVAIEAGGGTRFFLGTDSDDSSTAVVRYGLFTNDYYTEKGYLYVQGNATALDNMPQSGEFTYLGKTAQGKYKYGSWYADNGPAYAKVNFADKTAHIELNTAEAATQNGNSVNNKVDAYTFDGKITENSVAGAAKENADVKMQAGFFGDNAKYLSGMYKSDSVQGVFGTTKQ